MEQDQIF